jgi:hypothetical protein
MLHAWDGETKNSNAEQLFLQKRRCSNTLQLFSQFHSFRFTAESTGSIQKACISVHTKETESLSSTISSKRRLWGFPSEKQIWQILKLFSPHELEFVHSASKMSFARRCHLKTSVDIPSRLHPSEVSTTASSRFTLKIFKTENVVVRYWPESLTRRIYFRNISGNADTRSRVFVMQIGRLGLLSTYEYPESFLRCTASPWEHLYKSYHPRSRWEHLDMRGHLSRCRALNAWGTGDWTALVNRGLSHSRSGYDK